MKTEIYKVLRHPETTSEIQKIVDYYNLQIPKLGNRFYSVLKKEIKSLRKDALLYQIRFDDVRAISVFKFPYLVLFTIDENVKKCSFMQLFVHIKILKKSGRKNSFKSIK